MVLGLSVNAKSLCGLELNSVLEPSQRKIVCHTLMHHNFITSLRNVKNTKGVDILIRDLDALTSKNIVELGKFTSKCYDVCISSLPRVNMNKLGAI